MSRKVKSKQDQFSVSQAAELLGVIPVRVRQLCQDGRMGVKIGTQWVVTREEINAYKKSRRQPGRPKKV